MPNPVQELRFKLRILRRSPRGMGKEFSGCGDTVGHRDEESVRSDVHTNTAENSFALVKRGTHGVSHNVSNEHFHHHL